MYTNYDSIFPSCEVVSVQGKPYLFSNLRIARDTIPEGLFAYDVADDCDGEFWRIQPFVIVNHWGTIIGKEEIKLDERSQYFPLPEEGNENHSTEGNFLGDACDSTQDYLKRYDILLEQARGGSSYGRN